MIKENWFVERHTSSVWAHSPLLLPLGRVVIPPTTTTKMLRRHQLFLVGLLALGDPRSVTTSATSNVVCSTPEQHDDHPVLCRMLQWAHDDLDSFVQAAQRHASQHGLLVGEDWTHSERPVSVKTTFVVAEQRRGLGQSLVNPQQQQQLPVVFAHGMGDSCFNSGMQHIVKHTSELLGGVYTTCIPTGSSQAEDTKNGYFLSMQDSVAVFAQAVMEDPQLQNGFHAIGFSQGNNVIRGYIAHYNAPPRNVHTFISINGVNAGEGAVPNCFPSTDKEEDGGAGTTVGDFCDFLMEQASHRAYTEFAQKHSFQANYWRDPRPSALADYQKYCQLAKWNNEAGFINSTLVENWSKTQSFVWVMATKDSMVWPKEGEHWGAPDPVNPFHNSVLPMKETEWYKKDLFGLRTADEQKKNHFETFEGDHLRFSMEDFDRWVQTYLTP